MAQWPDASDRCPGKVPDIWVDAGDVVFALPVAVSTRSGRSARLMLRCTREGELWIAIAEDPEECGPSS
jgi:hypothetical protein